MRWLRLVGIAALQLPVYGGSWLMMTALIEDQWGWRQFAGGVLFGVLMGGIDVVRRGRRDQHRLRRDRLARYVRRGFVPLDDDERARLTQYVRRQRRHWHPFWLTVLAFTGIAAGGFVWAAVAGGRPRLWGALLVPFWLAVGLVVERVNLSRQSRMERLLGVVEPPMRPRLRRSRSLSAEGSAFS